MRVADLYDADPEREWERLTRDPYHRLEFAVFSHHLERYLPERGLVLDAGGGPGRWAIELCRRGYDVVLLDVSSGCVDLARTKLDELAPESRDRLKEFVVGDILDLSRFDAAIFDAVLCLDPLSCIADPTDRRRAMSELTRVTKPEGLIALGVRGFLDQLRTIVRLGGEELVGGSLEELRRTGNNAYRGVMHHYFRVSEIREFAERGGLKTLLLAGGEGLSSGMPEATERIAADADMWRVWRDLVIETSTDPAVVDTSGHILYLGRRPAAGAD